MMVENQKSNDQEKKPRHCVKKGSVHVCLELMATVFIVLAIVIGIGVWRIASGPLDIAFAKPTIVEALKDSKTGMHVDFDQAVLHWPDLKGPLLLGLRGGKVYDREDRLVFAIDGAALSLNKAKLLIGKVSPEGLILRKPSVLLKRSMENSFSVGLTSDVAAESEGNSSAQVSLDDVFAVFGRSGDGGRLSSLKLVRIEGARVLIDDMVLSRSWQVPRVDASLRREPNGLRFEFDVDLPRLAKTPQEIIPNFEGSVFAGWESEQIELEGVLTQFHTRFLSDKIPELAEYAEHDVRVDATAKAILGRDFSVRQVEGVVFSKGGSLILPDHYDLPLQYQDFGGKASYDAVNGTGKVEDLKLTVGGVALGGEADVSYGDDDFKVVGRVDIAEVAHKDIVPLWPKSLEEDNAKEWVIDKLSDGVFRNVFADFEVAGVRDEDNELLTDLNQLKAGFDFENLSAKYKSTMAPAKKGAGKGSFDYKSETLRILLSSAQILDLNVSEADLVFKDIIQENAGKADLTIKTKGPFQTMLRYLSDEPVGLKVDADLKDVKGSIESAVNLKFPTKDEVLKNEIELDVTGTIYDAHLPMVVKDLPLSGGPFDIAVKDGLFALKGSGQLDGRAVDLSYSEYLFSEGKPYSSKTVAKITADQDLREKLGIDLSEFLEGPAAVDVTYITQNDNSALADVTADITSARLFMKPFDYEKKAGGQGEATLKAHLKNDELIKITDLRGTAPDVSLALSALGFRTVNEKTELSAGKISGFQVGKTKGKIDFEVTPAGLLKLSMIGSHLDLRPFLNDDGNKDEPYSAPPMQVSAEVDVMRTSDDGKVRGGKLYADLNGQGKINQFEFDATAGAGAIYMRFKPDVSGKRVFRLEADDAGAALKAFEVYDSIRGGKLVVYGEPIRGIYDRNLIGKAEITDFKVVDAPALAQIISALSLPGAANMLGGEGLSFSKLEADFDWLFRPRGSLLVLKDGRTSGNSMGLTFDGTFDNAVQKIDVNGTIIPLSGINNLLKDIPLVGNILGGESGLFAATYSIKGEGKEPEVSVNPLSVLAPGILRNILFEGSAPSE
jgi:hypothetical protein